MWFRNVDFCSQSFTICAPFWTVLQEALLVMTSAQEIAKILLHKTRKIQSTQTTKESLCLYQTWGTKTVSRERERERVCQWGLRVNQKERCSKVSEGDCWQPKPVHRELLVKRWVERSLWNEQSHAEWVHHTNTRSLSPGGLPLREIIKTMRRIPSPTLYSVISHSTKLALELFDQTFCKRDIYYVSNNRMNENESLVFGKKEWF